MKRLNLFLCAGIFTFMTACNFSSEELTDEELAAESEEAVNYKVEKAEDGNKLIIVQDPQMNTKDAITFTVPKSYKLNGGIFWNLNPNTSIYYPQNDFRIYNEEKGTSAFYLPNESLLDKKGYMANMTEQYSGQKIYQDAQPAEQAMQSIVIPMLNQRFGNVEVKNIKMAEKQYPVNNAPPGMQVQTKNMEMQFTFQQDGTDYNGKLSGFYSLIESNDQGMYGNEYTAFWGYEGLNGIVYPAKSENKYIAELEDILKSGKINQDWKADCQRSNQQQDQAILNKMSTDHNQRMRQNQANFDAHQNRMKQTQQTYDQQNANWRAQQNASDKSHQQFIDGIRDEQDYYDPNTGQTQKLSNQYDHQWTDGNETYGTNDPNYNPNSNQSNKNYYKMQPKK